MKLRGVHDHLVAGPDAERLQRNVERDRSVHQRDRVARAHPFGELALELRGLPHRSSSSPGSSEARRRPLPLLRR